MLDSRPKEYPALSPYEFIPKGTQFMPLPDRFPMKRGGHLSGARVAFETWGSLSAARDNAILILTGLSPNAHAASSRENPDVGWWENIVGPGKAIDTNHWFVICANSLGSCKGSTGPASRVADGNHIYRLSFPDLSIEDIADAAARTVVGLGIEQLTCLIGCSMGGMSALSFIERHPGLARNHINVSSAVHGLPFALAIRSLQRTAIRQDPNWQSGCYDADTYPTNGMGQARKLGLVSYRSAQEWDVRFGRDGLGDRQETTPDNLEFAIEEYLNCHAARFVRDFDPNAYLMLSHSIDRFDLGDCADGDADTALSRLDLDHAMVIGTDTDILFPLSQQCQIAEGLKKAGTKTEFVALSSCYGHDSFLVDTQGFGQHIAAFLEKITSSPMSTQAERCAQKDAIQ